MADRAGLLYARTRNQEPKPNNDIKNQIINQTKKGEPNYGKSN